jgi:branched-chain amino acid transport system permease protein
MTSQQSKIMAVCVALAALAIIVPFTSSFIILLVTRALVFAILVMSLDILLGFTGLASLGQAAYLGVGAYLTAILATRYQFGLGFDFWLVILFGILGGAALAAVFGLLAIRATGVYFLMITLALGQCVWGLAYRWNSLTGGDNGINLRARPKFGIDLANEVTFFYLVLCFFALSLLTMYVLVRSPFGRSLTGIRERELRMRILGYNTWERGADHVGRRAADGGAWGRWNLGRRCHRFVHCVRIARVSQHCRALVAICAGRGLRADDPVSANRPDGNSGAHSPAARALERGD